MYIQSKLSFQLEQIVEAGVEVSAKLRYVCLDSFPRKAGVHPRVSILCLCNPFVLRRSAWPQ